MGRILTQTVGEKLLLGDFNTEIDNLYDEIENFVGDNINDGSITAAKLANSANPQVFFGEIFNDQIVTNGLTYVSDTGLTITLAAGTAYILQDSTSPTKLVRVKKALTSTISLSASTTQYIDLKSNGSFVVSTSTTVTTDASRLHKVITNASTVTSKVDIADRVFGDNFAQTFGDIKNVVLRTTSVKIVQLDANFVVLSEDGNFQITHGSAITADIEASIGAGGLDQGSESTDEWYAVILIADSTGVSDPALLLVDKTDWLADTEIIPLLSLKQIKLLLPVTVP